MEYHQSIPSNGRNNGNDKFASNAHQKSDDLCENYIEEDEEFVLFSDGFVPKGEYAKSTENVNIFSSQFNKYHDEGNDIREGKVDEMNTGEEEPFDSSNSCDNDFENDATFEPFDSYDEDLELEQNHFVSTQNDYDSYHEYMPQNKSESESEVISTQHAIDILFNIDQVKMTQDRFEDVNESISDVESKMGLEAQSDSQINVDSGEFELMDFPYKEEVIDSASHAPPSVISSGKADFPSKESGWKEQQQTDPRFLLEYWGLPRELNERYRTLGIKRLYPWQVGCLDQREVILRGSNLIYCAPTSGGKTLVAEILMARRLLQKKGKCIFIVPFVALAEEKTDYFQNLFQDVFSVEGLYGSKIIYSNFDEDADITVCTIEKANSIINRMVENGRLHQLSMLVIDEIHMIRDKDRGYILELLLTKLLYAVPRDTVQIVGLSATLPNVDSLASWLRAQLFVTNFRPVPLSEFFVKNNEVFSSLNCSKPHRLIDFSKLKGQGIPDDEKALLILTEETIMEGNSVMIFCHSRQKCRDIAKKVAIKLSESLKPSSQNNDRKIYDDQTMRRARLDLVQEMKKSPAGIDQHLQNCITGGVAFHHAGLTVEERAIIEKGFREGSIQVLTATTTLSAGVNLPARRVIFSSRGPSMYDNLEVTTYKQSAGRAGRAGQDDYGESYYICSCDREKNKIINFMQESLPPLYSCLMRDCIGLRRALLEVIAGGIVTTDQDVKQYIKCTLYGHQKPFQEVYQQAILDIGYLKEFELIEMEKTDKFEVTKLGVAVFASGIDPKAGKRLFDAIEEAQKCMFLDTDMHILYVLVLEEVAESAHMVSNNHLQIMGKLMQKLSPAHRRLADHIGVDDGFIEQMKRLSVKERSTYSNTFQKVRRFFLAMILQDIIDEVPLSTIEKVHGVDRGLIQKMQQNTAAYSTIATTFCQKLNWWKMESLFVHLRDRLHYGVQLDILPLCQIPSVKPQLARVLFNCGYKTVDSVASASSVEIEKIISNKSPFISKKVGQNEKKAEEQMSMKIIREAKMITQFEEQLQSFKFNTSISPLRPPLPSGSPPRNSISQLINYKQNYFSPPKPQRVNSKYFSSPKESPTKGATSEISNSRNKKLVDGGTLNTSETGVTHRGERKGTKRRLDDSFQETIRQFNFKGVESEVSSNVKRTRGVNHASMTKMGTAPKLDSRNLPFKVIVISDDDSFMKFIALWKKQTSYCFELLVREEKNHAASPKVSRIPELVRTYHAVLGMAVCWKESVMFPKQKDLSHDSAMVSEGYYITFQDKDDFTSKLTYIVPILENRKTVKVCFGLKEVIKILTEYGVSVLPPFIDPKIAAWIISPEDKQDKQEEHTIEELMKQHANRLTICGSPHNHEERIIKRVAQAWILAVVLYDMVVQTELDHPFNHVEMALVPILARIEYTGIGYDKNVIPKLRQTMIAKMEELEHLATESAGTTFNMESPQDCARILYDVLKLPEIKPTKSRQYKRKTNRKVARPTGKEILDQLSRLHPVPAYIKAYRSISKAARSHLMQFPKLAVFDPESNSHRIFSTCMQTTCATGRLSFINPNMQNVPHEITFESPDPKSLDKLERVNIRDSLIAREGYILLSADYSQIEVRLLAHFSKDPKLVEILTSPDCDIFTRIASEMFRKEESKVSSQERENAKRTVYGMLYGMGSAALSQLMEIDKQEADMYIQSFKRRFDVASLFLDHATKSCEEFGYVWTLFSRKRYLPGIYSKNQEEKAKAQRQAKNTICQGSAADLIKIAMIAIHKELYESSLFLHTGEPRRGPIAHMILQIHDELLFEVKQEYIDNVVSIVKKCMEKVIKLTVPTPIKVRIGEKWGSLRDYKIPLKPS